jgi:hypothetical protein
MTIDELYQQTNLIEHVGELPKYMQGSLQYEKSYKISVLDVNFKAVKFDKCNNVVQFYLLDYSHIPERFIAKMLQYKGVDSTKYLEGFNGLFRSVHYHNVKHLTQQRAQNIINRNIVFFRQFKERAERQKLIDLVNNL